jgi:hypothetical protein
MRDWYLGAGDPLALTLAADARLGALDYANDHIWELELGGGDPPALAVSTTYGLRARSMRLFPRFGEGGRLVQAPAEFSAPPRLRRFYPNFLALACSPFPGLEVLAEYWVPSSQTLAGRLTLSNHAAGPRQLKVSLAGLLVPAEGQSLAPARMQSVNVLAGRSEDLVPLVFLTGGPQHGPGPYPSLDLDLQLTPGAKRQFVWVQAALDDSQASFELARRTAARPWDAERARIELLNLGQTVDVQTGDPDWDAAFALSQKAAFSLLVPGTGRLPRPSFVLARQPDHGHSPSGDGSDYPPARNGQPPLEAYYLGGLLPGAPSLAKDLLLNFLSVQAEDGFVDCRPGPAGPRGRFLAAPLLASLARQAGRGTHPEDFLEEVFPALQAFFWAWFSPERAGDGLPTWEHALQSGFEDNPLFDSWHPWGQGVRIDQVRSPSLIAMLYREATHLAGMAERLGRRGEAELLRAQAERLQAGLQACWDPERAVYRYTDRETGLCLPGKVLSRRRPAPSIRLEKTFKQPARLLVRLESGDESTRRPQVTIHGALDDREQSETLERGDFLWGGGRAAATSRKVYTRVASLEVEGLGRRDRLTVQTVDLTGEDHTLLIPLWAGLPDRQAAQVMLEQALFEPRRFYRPFGAPACPSMPGAEFRAGSWIQDEGLPEGSQDARPGGGAVRGMERKLTSLFRYLDVDLPNCPPVPVSGEARPDPAEQAVFLSVHLPWNLLLGEGLLAYGFRQHAARMLSRLMAGVIQNLKQNRAFYQFYNANTGAGIGERNALHGLAPLGLFLETLGVEILSPQRVRLSGGNPFPWPVTVQYRGLAVTRREKETQVTFPNGKTVTLNDPTDAVVSCAPEEVFP